MLRRIVILSFCLLFLVSTTGLPLTIHFCKMTKKTIINSSCNMCGMDMSASKSTDIPSVRRALGSCCSTSTFDNNVKDNFLSFQKEFNYTSVSLLIICPAVCPINLYGNTISFNDTSPPGQLSSNLYLVNSILLI